MEVFERPINAFLDEIVSSQVGEGSQAIKNRYLGWIRMMGRRIAEMHLALAGHTEIPEFKPEPIAQSDVDFWISDLLARADRVFTALERRQHSLTDVDGDVLRHVLTAQDSLHEIASALARSCIGHCKIRHHGDLHLGQILVADDDAYIIDFEGEPSRPIADRRRKAPAARDVAGVVRSLDYAAMSAMQRTKGAARSPEIVDALMDWRDGSTAAFLDAYRRAAGKSLLWPIDAPEAESMLGFFLLEKAFYEVEYELSYRPGWVSIPLRGIARIVANAKR